MPPRVGAARGPHKRTVGSGSVAALQGQGLHYKQCSPHAVGRVLRHGSESAWDGMVHAGENAGCGLELSTVQGGKDLQQYTFAFDKVFGPAAAQVGSPSRCIWLGLGFVAATTCGSSALGLRLTAAGTCKRRAVCAAMA